MESGCEKKNAIERTPIIVGTKNGVVFGSLSNCLEGRVQLNEIGSALREALKGKQ